MNFRFHLAVFLSFAAFQLVAGILQGNVIGITDGDTLTLLDTSNVQYKVRLVGIDAPEKKQAYGNIAKKRLSDLVFRKTVTVQFKKKDKYGRVLGKVLCEGKEINLKLIQEGLAWHYKHYAKDQKADDRSRYANEEIKARAFHVGLWADKRPVAPWDFRPHRELAEGRKKSPRKARRR